MKIVKYGLLVATMYLFTGCMSQIEKEVWNFYHKPSESFNIAKIKEECNAKGKEWEVRMFSDGSGLCVNKKAEELQRLAREKREKEKLEHYASYEKNYLSEYESLKKTFPQVNVKWIQPKNKKEPCKIFVSYLNEDYTKDDSYKLFWDGGCKNGYAHGLGREIEKADLIDRWQIGIYRDGKPNGYGMQYNNLHDLVIEGEMNYDENKLDYQVHRKVFEKNGDINIMYRTGAMGTPLLPNLYIETSPFWNNSIVHKKTYPNFYYQFRDLTQNDMTNIDFGFEIVDTKTNQRNGWGYEKNKGQTIVKGEYINGKPNAANDLPDVYMTKADSIINEVKQANNKALEAQEHAQLIKKQYINKICKDSVKVSFMDNDEYKIVCNNQKEKTLYSKVQDKLERITKEKIARLEQQRFSQQQAKEEQYRQQQLTIERQKMEQQRRQAAAAEEANNQRAWDSLNQSIQNMNTNMYRQNQNFQMWQLNNNLNNINNTLRAW